MTRRVLKPQPDFRGGYGDYHDAEEWGWEDEWGDHVSVLDIAPNGYGVGDRLWVRETWTDEGQSEGECLYRATVEDDTGYYLEEIAGIRWRPSIHMPRWASRLTLTVTDVRVQRVQEISEEDSIAEGIHRVDPTPDDLSNGCTTDDFVFMAPGVRQGWGATKDERDRDQWWPTATGAFRLLWDSLNAKRGYGWDINPWVVALTFTVERRNIDAAPAQDGGL